MSVPSQEPETPRWVSVFGAMAIVLALFVLFVIFASGGGPHGRARHMAGDPGGHTQGQLLVLLGILTMAGVALNWSRLHRMGARLPSRWPRAGGFSTLMTPRLRKLALTAHIVCSVSSLGAVAAFLVLAIAGLQSADVRIVRAAYPAMELMAGVLIVPLIVASLLTGLVSSLGTPWGLLRHYWVLVKLLLTAFTLVVLLMQMDVIRQAGAAAAGMEMSDLIALRRSLVTHAIGGLVALLTATTLAVFKPRGATPHGARTVAD